MNPNKFLLFFSVIFLVIIGFSAKLTTRYTPKKFIVYPSTKTVYLEYYINITISNTNKKICTINDSSLENYLYIILGMDYNLYKPSKLPKTNIINISKKYEKKTCIFSLFYKYSFNTRVIKNRNIVVEIKGFVLNPYPDSFDQFITNKSMIFYKINPFEICVPNIYRITSIVVKKSRIYYAYNTSNYPVSLVVLNITFSNNTSFGKILGEKNSGFFVCYDVYIPYKKPIPKKIGTINLGGVNYYLYYTDVNSLYEIILQRQNKEYKKMKIVRKHENVRKIFYIIIFILIVIIIIIIIYYKKKERGGW